MLRRREKGAAELHLPLGHIAHASPARSRLSFPDLKGRDDLLDALCVAVRQIEGVHSAEGRPLTGSVIIAHEGGLEDLVEAARAAQVFDIRDLPEGPDPLAEARAWKEWADRSVRETLGPGINLRTVAAFAFIAMALRQLAAGSIMPPAATALWYGLSLLLAVNLEPGVHTQGDGE